MQLTPKVHHPPRSLGVLLAFLTLLFGLIGWASQAGAIVCNNEGDISGKITFLNPEQKVLAVNGLLYRTDADTQIQDAAEAPIDFSALNINDSVRVKFCNTPGAPPVATRIRLTSGNSVECVSVEFVGTIDNINNMEKVLAIARPGAPLKLVKAVSSTLLLNAEGQPIPFETFRKGMSVQVEGCDQPNGNAVAKKIKIQDQPEDGIFVRFSGAIAMKSDENSNLVVAGRMVAVNEATEILNAEEVAIAFADLAVGDFVQVEGITNPAVASATPMMIVAAHKIKVEDTPPPPPLPGVRICGFLSLIGEDGSLVVNDKVVYTDENTKYFGREKQELTIADLAVGDSLCIEAVVQDDDTLLAKAVIKVDRVAREFEIRGRINAIADGVFTVGALAVHTNENTAFLAKDGSELTAADFAVGEIVEAEGIREGDGTHVARKIKKEDGVVPPPACVPSVELSGAIDSVSTEALTLIVTGRLVITEEFTRIRNDRGEVIPFSALEAGQIVKVVGNENEAGDVVACEIRQRLERPGDGDPLPQIRVYGEVKSIDADAKSFVVNETTVVTNEETEYKKRRGEDVAFEDVVLGARVIASGNLQSDGTFLARLVRILNENDDPIETRPIQLHGFVTALDLPTSFTVNRATLLVDGPVEVLAFDGAPAQLTDLQVGDFVNVEAAPAAVIASARIFPPPPPTFIVKKVRIRGAVVSAVDETSKTLQVAGYTVSTNDETEYRRAKEEVITFSDIAVGDLVRVKGEVIADAQILARRIVLLAPAGFSGPIPPYEPPNGDTEDGKPVICARNADNTFGFVQIPEGAFGTETNTLFEIKATVSTNVVDPTMVPQLRLRANNQSQQKAAMLVVDSKADGRYSPTPEGYEYRMLFMPALTPSTAGTNDGWFFSLDLLNFGGENAPLGCVKLESLNTRGISADAIRVEETLLDQSFDATSEGWNSGSAPAAFSSPESGSGINGTLDLAPPDRNSFGFWTYDTEVPVVGGAIYRGRFLIRASSTDAEKVPTIRVRLNLNSFTLASLSVAESVNGGDESPDADGKVYDAYLFVPEPAIEGDTIRASFDVLNFSPENDVDAPVSLDHFTLERVVIAE